MTITFKIEDKEFYIDESFLSEDSFEVKSSPKSYKAVWDNAENPKDTVENLVMQGDGNVLLVDSKVFELYFKDTKIPAERIYKLDATEDSKTVNSCLKVVEYLEERGFTKAETLVVVGGGIIQDTGAFVGACYKRGINWVLFPTTLLSMCDSCIGGKTGINHNKAKNQIALFSAPTKVVINPNFIKTLEPREIKSGLGEILKLLLTGGKKMFELYKKYVKDGKAIDFESYKPLILGSLHVKKSVIEEDEFEFNYRKSMNYGHTLGHAVEVLSNYEIPHGQAVAVGVVIVDKLSKDLGMLPEDERLEVKKYAMELLNREIVAKIRVDELADLLKKDKKTMGKTLTFALIKRPGEMVFHKEDLHGGILTSIEKIIREEFN